VDRVAPVRRGKRFRFEAGGIALDVDAACGGRIIEYSFDGRNVLFECDDDDKRGSTFWTSPQAAWSWPPPPEIDREPYEVRRADSSGVSLASRPSGALGVSVEKALTMARDGTVTIDYRIGNASSESLAAAPWEVTRVRRSGTSFFPRGVSVHASPRFPPPSHSESDGLVWLEHSTNDGHDRKLHADGPGGWLAHTDDGLLFVKTFESILPEAQAAGESMVEIFVSGSVPYVELEEQGAYERLEPGQSLSWRVVWRLARLPNHERATRSELANAASRLAGGQA
jgi:hypothetical protein